MTMHDYLLEGQGERAETGILLIHGLTGTPNEMRILARGLNSAGFTVYAVQLAGHCGTMDDLLDSTWQDWLVSVRAGADKLSQRVNKLIVGGLSMGAVLALALAEERPEQIAGVMALSTTFRHDGWSMPKYTRMAFILPFLRMLGIGRSRMFFEQPPYGIKDAALRKRIVSQMQAGDSVEAGLPGNPFWSVVEMQLLSSHVLKHLDRVRAPCLVLHASNDDIASVKNAMNIVRGVQHAPVQLVLLEDSYHMITIDRERRKVIDRCINFAIEISASDFKLSAHPEQGAIAHHESSGACL
ncbi:alpha/beta fold hydrolase [Enterobacteriaceae bacterium H18W14]|uniref:alpha/beta hydrolase n=1 Tax=Dryocola boscaweniae TaxID=2925397 RepID=UPI0022F002BA|nr:alpha/beta fold hydrolase [Dryocola boscaweniae]MCT4715465.1 alpha/beta fold hydrolase [Dryocola boscaweniae]